METTSRSEEFSLVTNKSRRNHSDIRTSTITIYSLHPPPHLSAATQPWFTAAKDGTLRHPLTLNHHRHCLPIKFSLSKLNHTILAVSHHSSFDKLLVVPTPTPTPTPPLNSFNYYNNINLNECILLALYDGGRLRGCYPKSDKWVKLSHGSKADRFDDTVFFNGYMYALDREGRLYLVFNHTKFRTLTIQAIQHFRYRHRWRKRLVVDGEVLYMVVRTGEKLFRLYKLVMGTWVQVQGFCDMLQVLFMGKYHYFFCRVEESSKLLENCIVFSEGAFPRYGNGCWELSRFGDVRRCEDDIAVFRLGDGTFAREGENSDFPKIDWSPPAWIFDACLDVAAESHSHSSSQSKGKPEEDEGFNSNCRDKKDGEVQSDLKDSNSEHEKDGDMQSDLIGQDKAQERIESYSDSRHQSGKKQCDLNIQENEGEGVARTLLCMNGGNAATKQGTLMKYITQLIPRACTSCTTKSHSKFEGFDVRSDLVPILQKIWRNHGNIIENSTMRSGDIVARALESLATMVGILEDNSAQSLSGSQVDYLSSTLCDLLCMCFKVWWLIPFVEKAVELQKSKHLLDSLNNLSHLSSQFKKRKTILFDELTKLGEEENKVKEEMAKVSKMIPFSGQVKFDEPLGSGLT